MSDDKDKHLTMFDFDIKKPRGFAALTPEQRKLVAAAGGRSVNAHKRAFSVDNDLASRAGRKGGATGRGGGRPRKDSEEE